MSPAFYILCFVWQVGSPMHQNFIMIAGLPHPEEAKSICTRVQRRPFIESCITSFTQIVSTEAIPCAWVCQSTLPNFQTEWQLLIGDRPSLRLK